MKKISLVILAISGIILFNSCSKSFEATKEVEKDNNGETIEYSITASIEDLVSTKAIAEPVIRIKWEKDDLISVLDLTNYKILGTLKAESEGTDVVFAGTIQKLNECTHVGYVYPAIPVDPATLPASLKSKVEIGVNFAEQTVNSRSVFCASAVDPNPGEYLGNKKIKFTIRNAFIEANVTDLPENTPITKIGLSKLGSKMSWDFSSGNSISTTTTESKGIVINSSLSSSNKGYLIFCFSCPPAEVSEETRYMEFNSNGTLIKNAAYFKNKIEGNQYIGTVTRCQKLFSISADKQVEFSLGNLQAVIESGAPTAWKFANPHYSYIGNAVANTTIGSGSGTIDLFGWSTDGGASPTQTYKQWGINGSINNADYAGNFVDWGNNPAVISSLGSGWRTLESSEWTYLLSTRNQKLRKIGVTIDGNANCMIIAPDGYNYDLKPLKTTYTSSEWAAAEAEGLVCLPPAGNRNYNSSPKVSGCGTTGYYWSSTLSSTTYALSLSFNTSVDTELENSRYQGKAVRLVRE